MNVHSIDTFGTADGPGIRFVLFLQGCEMKCKYCHNPDSWTRNIGTEMNVDAVMREMEPFVPFYRESGGGVTVGGGEPLLQAEDVKLLFQRIHHEWGLHTALDTSGFGFQRDAHSDSQRYALLAETDLVILDLKAMADDLHHRMTSQSNRSILAFGDIAASLGTPMRIRHVLIPGWTDSVDELVAIGAQIAQWKRLAPLDWELLPFHQMGADKWKKLGWHYTFDAVQTPSAEAMARANSWIQEGILSVKPSKKSGSQL